jgi:prolyl-tRNA editing enzyme YbaK/EbsC (Cys-tRNA(Pro) deacylase)
LRGPLDLSRGLLEADVAHEIVHLRRRIDDAHELPEVLGVPSHSCLAVRLFDSDRGLLAALLPTGVVPATTALAEAVAARTIRAIRPAKVSEVTDYHPALVPPIGLPDDLLVVADAALSGEPIVFTATGDGSTALKIRTEDLLTLTGAVLAPLVEPGLVAGPRA